MPTLRHGPEAVAVRVPVAPGFAKPAAAVSVATAADPVVARSHCSLMPAGAVKLDVLLQAPPKTRSAFGAVVVIDGALTESDCPPLL